MMKGIMGLNHNKDCWYIMESQTVEEPVRKGIFRRPTGEVIRRQADVVVESYPLCEGTLMAQFVIFQVAYEMSLINTLWHVLYKDPSSLVTEDFNRNIDASTGQLTEDGYILAEACSSDYNPPGVDLAKSHPLAGRFYAPPLRSITGLGRKKYTSLLYYLSQPDFEQFVNTACRECRDDIGLLENLQQYGYPVDSPRHMIEIGEEEGKGEVFSLPYRNMEKKIGRIAVAMAKSTFDLHKVSIGFDCSVPQRAPRDPRSDAIIRAAARIETHYNITDLDKL